MKKRKRLKLYQDSNGNEPFTDWLESIKDRKSRARILTRLDRLEVGNPGDHRHLSQGVYELRIQFGPGYRVYYGEDGPVFVILLMGGDKNSQANDIQKATTFWKSYKETKR